MAQIWSDTRHRRVALRGRRDRAVILLGAGGRILNGGARQRITLPGAADAATPHQVRGLTNPSASIAPVAQAAPDQPDRGRGVVDETNRQMDGGRTDRTPTVPTRT